MFAPNLRTSGNKRLNNHFLVSTLRKHLRMLQFCFDFEGQKAEMKAITPSAPGQD